MPDAPIADGLAVASPDSPRPAACDPLAVDFVQHLGPDGVLNPDAPFAAYSSGLVGVRLREAYRAMALTRRFDVEATALQRQGELALWVPSLGQEAAQVGSAMALEASDYVFPSYRDHGVLQVRGLDLTRLFALFRGTSHGGWDPRETRTHLYTLVIGSQTLHAAGYAMGVGLDAARGVPGAADEAVICYFGDGATSQGDVSEALNLAAVTKAPLVFFCQNNGWAISEPNERQTATDLFRRGEGFGVPGVRVDGNDVVACHAVTRWALERARSGEGPTFVEAYTFRRGAHTTSDDPTRYRSRELEAAWEARDPLDRLELHLRSQGVDQAFFDSVVADGDELAEHARAACRALTPGTLTDHLAATYATFHPQVAEEMALLAAEGRTLAVSN